MSLDLDDVEDVAGPIEVGRTLEVLLADGRVLVGRIRQIRPPQISTGSTCPSRTMPTVSSVHADGSFYWTKGIPAVGMANLGRGTGWSSNGGGKMLPMDGSRDVRFG